MPLTLPAGGFYVVARQSLTMQTTCITAPTAVILAAGLGSRLQADHPKGLIEIGPGPLLGRSLNLLQAADVKDIVLVGGWKQEVYGEFLRRHFPAVRMVSNPDFATTGSLASLVIGLRATTGDVLVVESDLLFERRAVTAVLSAPGAEVLLASGYTTSGDEVWVYARNGRLAHLAKAAWSGAPRVGELVGLTRLSRPAADDLVTIAATLPVAAHYEDGLNVLCAARPVEVCLVPDLQWCEIDTADHLRRAREQIWPRIRDSDHTAVRSP